MRSWTILLAVTLFSVPFLTVAADPGDGNGNGAAGGTGHPACTPNAALENDEVRLWFQGLKGHLKVFDMNSTDGDGVVEVYDYQTQGVSELGPDNETLATFDLGRAYPQDSLCRVVETDTWLNITFTVTRPVRDVVARADLGPATVTFVYHWNKSADGAKFDLFVNDWPWQSNESHLAFSFRTGSPVYDIEVAENGLGFRNSTGDSVGYIEWAANATAYYGDGSNATALVDAETAATDRTAEVTLHFTNVGAGYTRLVYDPWVGVGDYVILLGVLIPLGQIAAILPPALKPVYGELVSPLV